MLESIFSKIKHFSKFIISMIITFFGFFLSNKNEDEGTQKTIKKQLKISKGEIINYNETLKEQPLELYPFYKQKTEKILKDPVLDFHKHQKELEKLLKEIPKTEEMKPIRQKIEKRLNELKVAPSIKKTLSEKPVLNKSHIVKTQKGITPPKRKPKLQTPTIKPNEPIKKSLKDSKKPNHESKPILTRYPQYQTGQVKQKQEPLVTKKPALQKVAPLVAIIPPAMAMHLIRKAQNQELKASQSPNFSIQKSSPSIALDPKVVPKTKYVVPQVYLNEAIHLSKYLDKDATNKQKISEEKDNIPDKVEYLLNKKPNSKARLLPFKLFKRKEVQDLYNSSLLNNNLVSSVNLVNGTNFSYHKVHFLTLLSRKKTLASLENVTAKNIKTAQMLKVSMKNKYSDNPKLNGILKRLEEIEEELNKKYERLNHHNYSKAKMKSKKPIRPF